MEEKANAAEAAKLFLQAWNESTEDFEKFLSAHFLARSQKNITDKLKWLETALQLAVQINDDTVKSAFPMLYSSIAKCYEDLATSFNATPSDKGPFYHGTKADLKAGDLLKAGESSNYQAELKMNHIYFTALANGAGLAAELAKGDKPERVYVVEPTGPFENDPNVTNNKFPGNPTRSYRSSSPLKIVGEVTDWRRQTAEEIQKWRDKLSGNTGKIIN
jgi:hypothetical protein